MITFIDLSSPAPPPFMLKILQTLGLMLCALTGPQASTRTLWPGFNPIIFPSVYCLHWMRHLPQRKAVDWPESQVQRRCWHRQKTLQQGEWMMCMSVCICLSVSDPVSAPVSLLEIVKQWALIFPFRLMLWLSRTGLVWWTEWGWATPLFQHRTRSSCTRL